jgi:hypothetical protein
MQKIIAIKRNDNGVTWLSGPMDFGNSVQNHVDGETTEDYVLRLFGYYEETDKVSRFKKFLWLETRQGQEIFFPVDKIESVELRDYTEDAYEGTCGS